MKSPHRQAVDIIMHRLGSDTAAWLLEASNALLNAGIDNGPMMSLALAACARPDLYYALEAARAKPVTLQE